MFEITTSYLSTCMVTFEITTSYLSTSMFNVWNYDFIFIDLYG